MKLNAATELIPSRGLRSQSCTCRSPEQAAGTRAMLDELEKDLATITAAEASATEFRRARGVGGADGHPRYHEARGEGHRDVCLIPSSAHGTNPVAVVMAGMRVVVGVR